MTIHRTLEAQIAELYRRDAERTRRDRNRKRTGVVAEVDHEKGLARVKLSTQSGKDFLSGWLPWKEVASGGIKSHIPPTVGEQVNVVSESGDLTDAEIDMSVPSTANPRPHDGPEAVITKGDVRIQIADSRTDVNSPLVKIVGNVKIVGRLHVEEGIHDRGGVFSTVGCWPPAPTATPPVEG